MRDTGHTLALIVEQVYAKSSGFRKYIKALSAAKVREVMRPTGYLLPPAQCSIARFMNLSGVINWSKQILSIFTGLNDAQKQAFGFVETNRKLVNELSPVFKTVNVFGSGIK
jgi:hypothetical protein